MKRLSLRPYSGNLYFAKTKSMYEKGHKKLFKTEDLLNCTQSGRFSGGKGDDGMWTYIIWAKDMPNIVHELSHVLLHLFQRIDVDPREANGEPFCYLIGQLMQDIKNK